MKDKIKEMFEKDVKFRKGYDIKFSNDTPMLIDKKGVVIKLLSRDWYGFKAGFQAGQKNMGEEIFEFIGKEMKKEFDKIQKQKDWKTHSYMYLEYMPRVWLKNMKKKFCEAKE